MTDKKFLLQILASLGLALIALILTMRIPALTQADANITIVKESDQVVVKGDQATFVMTVTNTSGVTLTEVAVTDPECTVTGPGGDTNGDGILDTSETWTYSCSRSNVTGSFTNIATVNGKRGDDQTAVTDNDSATVTVADISVAKSTNTPVVASGSNVNFTIVVTNTGDADLENVTITDDPGCDTLSSPSGDNGDGKLNKDEDWSYTCTVNSVTADFTNVATATATAVGASGVQVQKQSNGVAIDVINPSLNVQKSTNTPTVLSNSNVDFTIVVTNTGDADLENVIITDDPGCDTLSSPSGDDGDGKLNQDEDWSYTCTVNSVTVDFTNVATATATVVEVTPAIQVEDSGQAAVDVINPGIDVEKTPASQTVSSGNAANFTITVDNTGDTDLTNVSVVDTKCGSLSNPTGDTGNDGIMGKDETWTYPCSVNNVDEGFINSVTVSGKPAVGDNVTDSDAAQVILTEVAQACPVQGQATVDMIAYWKLDEQDNGATGYDDFYSDHDGVCVGGNCPTSQLEGRVGGAQAFNGTNTKINIPVIAGDDAFNWGLNDSFSIEFWMKGVPGKTCAGSDVINNEVIIGRDDSNTYLHWWLGCENTNGRARFHLTDVNNNLVALRGPSINDGAWHHVVGVRDGNADQNLLYVDGVDVTEVRQEDDYNAGFGSASAPLNLGWLNLGAGFHFEGQLDEVAVHNRVLSPAEIAAHYNNGTISPGYCGAPAITSTPGLTVNIGQQYSYDVDAVGNPAPTYTLTIFPTGMTIAQNTGQISWTPTPAQKGNHTVRVKASNWLGQAFQEFIVSAGLVIPEITSQPVTQAVVNELYTYDVEASGNPIPTYSLTVFPTGMTIDQNTGEISWTPTLDQQGNHNVQVKAINSEGTDTQDFTVEVGLAAPIFTSNPVTEATVGEAYSYDVDAVGNPAPTYTLTIFPTGMTIDQNTGQISWTPTADQQGNQAVTVVASNFKGTANQGFSITVGSGSAVYLPIIIKEGN